MKIRVLTVYKNSYGKQVAVDVQDCDTGVVNFMSIDTLISNINTWKCDKDNFIIVEGSRVQGKSGVNLNFKELLTYKEIKHKYPETNVKLSHVLRSHNNNPLGRILYAVVERTGTDEECDLDEIECWNKGVDVDWLCTRVDRGHIVR